MPLRYADYCKVCGQVRTRDPSGICSSCRKAGPTKRQLCKICGVTPTRNLDGICYECKMKLRRKGTVAEEEQTLEEVLHELKRLQFIVEQRISGKTFSEIAEMMGSTKSSVYKKYQKVIDMFRVRGCTYTVSEDE